MEGRSFEQKSPKEQSDTLLARARAAREERLAREKHPHGSGDKLPSEDIIVEYKPTPEEAERELARLRKESVDPGTRSWGSSRGRMDRRRGI